MAPLSNCAFCSTNASEMGSSCEGKIALKTSVINYIGDNTNLKHACMLKQPRKINKTSFGHSIGHLEEGERFVKRQTYIRLLHSLTGLLYNGQTYSCSGHLDCKTVECTSVTTDK